MAETDKGVVITLEVLRRVKPGSKELAESLNSKKLLDVPEELQKAENPKLHPKFNSFSQELGEIIWDSIAKKDRQGVVIFTIMEALVYTHG